MKSKTITTYGIETICHNDGAISRKRENGHSLIKTYGTLNQDGYRVVRRKTRQQYVHRLIAAAFLPDYAENLQVDHIDGNKSNNMPSNLRMVSQATNLRAYRPKAKNKTSQYRGVSKCGKKWRAEYCLNHKRTKLGTFDTEEEAAYVRDAAVLKAGFPEETLNFKI